MQFNLTNLELDLKIVSITARLKRLNAERMYIETRAQLHTLKSLEKRLNATLNCLVAQRTSELKGM